MVTAALITVATFLAVVARAAPVLHIGDFIQWGLSPNSPSSQQTSTSWTPSSPASSGQTPFSFPLANGFPNLGSNSLELSVIESKAHGTLPNSALPSRMSDTSATVWQVIALNELFEVAFYSSLLENITSGVPGFTPEPDDFRTELIEDLVAIRAQEELHALGANAILSTAGRQAVEACEYIFPTSTWEEAIAFAGTFTDLVLGTLQEAMQNFGVDGDVEYITLIGAVVGQEGEQDGYFRLLQRQQAGSTKIPSALPFLTASSGPFAFSALNQNVLLPGSCPNVAEINVPLLGSLALETPSVGAQTQMLEFSFASSALTPTSNTTTPADGLYLVLINQQNLPIVQNLTNVQTTNGTVSFGAVFPYEQYEMNGLTIGAVTFGSGPFANATEVAMAAVLGPVLIEVN